MQSKAATVEEYLASLPEERRAALQAVREVLLRNMDKRIVERMSYGMIGYAIPHSVHPAGYHCDPAMPLPYAGLASQKGHMSLYLMCVHFDPKDECAGTTPFTAWFREAWERTGKKLDMGRACIRFRKVEDLALDVIAEAVRRADVDHFIAAYEQARSAPRKAPSAKPARSPRAVGKGTKSSPRKPARPGRSASGTRSARRGKS